MEIKFKFEGCAYTAPESFYETNRFTLPDGRVIAAREWAETMPPRPVKLHVVSLGHGPRAVAEHKTIIVCKAGSLPDRLLPDVTIRIEGEPISPVGDTWAAEDAFYDAEAERLAEVLVHTLPGGALDRLLVCLLDHRASLLRVPMSRSWKRGE